MKYLLDTCTISELIKKKPVKKVIDWIDECDEESFFLSVLTIGEIQKGVAKLTDVSRRQKIQQWLDYDLIERFSGRIIAVSNEIALTWGIITGEAGAKGIPIPSIDGLIGATAITCNFTVATKNVHDIALTGARILNPWEL
jgi:predicted nucleic acid-binding protein